MTEKEAQGQIALLRNRYLARNAVVGQAFTMLTMEPRPDIAQYHDRQVVIWARCVELIGSIPQSLPSRCSSPLHRAGGADPSRTRSVPHRTQWVDAT